MPDQPRVSILLPCRNAAATVDAALQSLANQTFRAFEIIAVNDGSTDETGSVLAHWARRDDRVRAFDVAAAGIISALQTAARHATGALLARMDADDIANPARLAAQVSLLDDRQDIAACGTGVRYFPPEHVRAGARRYERWINGVITPEEIERDLFVECPIPHPTLVIRRTAFDAVGGYRDRGWPEDYDLVLHLWSAGHKLGKVPEVLLQWRERPDRLSRTDARYTEDAFRRCKAHFLGHRIAGRQVVVWGAGPVGKTFALALKDNGHDVAAFVDLDPRKIGQTIHEAPVVHPRNIGDYRSAFVVAAVGSDAARGEIRAALADAGFTEPDACCAVA